MSRHRAAVSDLALCSLLGGLIAWLATVLEHQGRRDDAAIFLLWAAAVPALGTVALRAAVGPTQRLLGAGLRPGSLVRLLAMLTGGVWLISTLTPATVLMLRGAPAELVGRLLLRSFAAVTLMAAVGQLLRSITLTTTGRGLAVGVGVAALLGAALVGAHHLPATDLILPAAVAAAMWAGATIATTRRTTHD